MIWGDDFDFEDTVEKAAGLPCHTACRRRAFRPADPQQHGNIQGAQQAAFVSTGMAVPGRVDNPVCPDGDCLIPGAGFGKAQPDGPDGLRRPARFQFCVVAHLFQHGAISVCLCLARVVVAAHPDYHRPVLPDFQAGGVSYAAISRMGDLCGLSEFGHLSAQLTAGALRTRKRRVNGATLARFCD